MMKTRHFLIVGAGLSGICVAYHLKKRGQKVTLIDNGINHSTAVAAAMINPLVFRRMTKSWRLDEFMAYLCSFYKTCEQETTSSFFHPIQLRRMFSSIQEKALWLERQNREDFTLYMESITQEDVNYDQAINEFGTGRVKLAHYINTTVFLPKMLDWIQASGEIIREEFDYSELNNNTYKGVEYDEIIFCEGYLNYKNPWFGSLPINNTKGETLLIRSTSLPEFESLNRKCFILPLGNQTFKVGSTYEWNNIDTQITKDGRQLILDNLTFLTKEKVDVLQQEAGIRPTTKDRRPIIGTHKKQKHYHIFNGLGAKGFMLAPLLSKEFSDYLVDGRPLLEEVRLDRF